MASVHPEKETLRKCNAEINKALAYNTDLVWFANRLFAKSFITAIQQSNVQNVGVGDYAKASKLMESVMAQVSITPSKYDEFLGILEEEAALDDLVKLLNSTYGKDQLLPFSNQGVDKINDNAYYVRKSNCSKKLSSSDCGSILCIKRFMLKN